MTETKSSSGVTAVGRVMIPVSDQDRALAFYTGTLGFETRADIPFGDGNRWIEVAPADGATALALVQPREGEATGVETRIALDSANIDATHAELRERGVDVDPEVMRMGGPVPPMFWFRDPDGNRLLIVEPGR
jgi:catechol 2,3-dioxygenase-like lactoylglutathione lyase family enzyme